MAYLLYLGFPWKKVPRYICSQILGGFVATLIVYGQYRPYILELEELLTATGKADLIFTASGPAGIFAIYPNAGIPLKWVFMNEFFAVRFLFVIFLKQNKSKLICFEYSRISSLVSSFGESLILLISSSPRPPAPSLSLWVSICLPFYHARVIRLILNCGNFVVGYATVIWGYVPGTVATNAARDVGCRLGTIAIWGTKAWGGNYAALSALTCIPATLCAATYVSLYFFFTLVIPNI